MDLNAATKKEELTVLMYSIRNGATAAHFGVVRRLLRHARRIELNAATKGEGYTALHYAARSDNEAAVALLLAKGGRRIRRCKAEIPCCHVAESGAETTPLRSGERRPRRCRAVESVDHAAAAQ